MAAAPGNTSYDVGAWLRAELTRLKAADPFQVLGVSPAVDGPAVRTAYLALTKRFHPNRFALEQPDTLALANEVFLLVRRAYETLIDNDKRNALRDKLAPAAPVAPAARATTQQGPIVPATRLPAPESPLAPLDDAHPAATAKPVTKLPAGPPPAAAPAKSADLTPSQVPVGPPPARVATVPANPAPPPRQAPGTGPNAPPKAAAEVQAMLESARTRGQRFDEAHRLLAQGKYRAAREALFQIAAEDPQNKRFRVALALAWGLEHHADGRLDEALRELERAVSIEPENQDAQAALKRVQDEKKKKGTGLFGKLFGK